MDNSTSPGTNASLPALFAATLAVGAFVAAIVGTIMDIPALGIVAAVIAGVLGAAVVWQNGLVNRLGQRADTAEREVIRLESSVADQVSAKVAGAPPAAPVAAAAAATPLASLAVNDTSDLADAETGLLGERYFVVTLEARVAAARRHLRPLALVLLEAVTDPSGDGAPLDARTTAEVVRETLRDADTLCRLQNGHFAILLEDTPENGAIWTVERIRRRLSEQLESATIWAGIACYPANGFDGPEVLDRARAALTSAREWRQDRTEVADA